MNVREVFTNIIRHSEYLALIPKFINNLINKQSNTVHEMFTKNIKTAKNGVFRHWSGAEQHGGS